MLDFWGVLVFFSFTVLFSRFLWCLLWVSSRIHVADFFDGLV